MAQLFFHCSNDDGIWIDRRLAAVSDLSEAMAQATSVVRSMVMAPSSEDWRSWTLHASDDFGNEVFAMPFVSVLGKAHWGRAMLVTLFASLLHRRVSALRRLMHAARDPYRPELHYMRGPGPKCRAKQLREQSSL
jgi:hypothetical protein